jgi:predicted flap endonuclease-1-like 5' DNA nuclease
MFYLIWQMGFLLLIAFAGGLFAGWQIWSSTARSAEADEALAEVARLRKENENLARRLGEAESETVAPLNAPTPAADVKRSAEPVPESRARKIPSKPAAKAKPAAPIAPAVDYVEADQPVTNDLLAIKGLGPKAAAMLREGGIISYAQIAAWTSEDVAEWETKINGRGRITRDEWVEQAKTLG